MPGGGGIGLPVAPRSGAPGGWAPGSGRAGGASDGAGAAGADAAGASAGADGAGVPAGVADAAGATGGAAGDAGGATGGAAGVADAGGATDGAAGVAGRADSSSTRRGGAGRSLPLEVTRRAGGLGLAGAAGSSATGAGEAGAGAGAGASSTGAGGAAGGISATGVGGASPAAAAFLVDFLTALAGSSGWTSRMRPSRSALRRTRSACASSMLEECVFTPIPSDSQRSSVSLFVIPSSLASSCTRFFGAKLLVQSFRGNSTAVHPRTNPQVGTILGAMGAVIRRPPTRGRGWLRRTREPATPGRGHRAGRLVAGRWGTRRRATPPDRAVYDRPGGFRRSAGRPAPARPGQPGAGTRHRSSRRPASLIRLSPQRR